VAKIVLEFPIYTYEIDFLAARKQYRLSSVVGGGADEAPGAGRHPCSHGRRKRHRTCSGGDAHIL